MKTIKIQPATAEIIKKLISSLTAENYSCQLRNNYQENKEFDISCLKDVKWMESCGDYSDEPNNPASKDISRALKHISEFGASVQTLDAVCFCSCIVTVDREETCDVELDNGLNDIRIEASSLDYQMKETDWINIVEKTKYTHDSVDDLFPPRIIKVINLNELPACEECGGKGEVICPDCAGYGDCRCPDCEGSGKLHTIDKEYWEDIWYRRKIDELSQTEGFRWYKNGQICPTCEGSGHFHCQYCSGKGKIKCPKCNGTGKIGLANTAQKVTRLKESYNSNNDVVLILQNGVDFRAGGFKFVDILQHTPPSIFRQSPSMQQESRNDAEFERNTKSIETIVQSEIEWKISESKNLVGMSYLAYAIPNIHFVTFTFNDIDYKIIVLDNHAFASDLPVISLIENLFGTYKRKIVK